TLVGWPRFGRLLRFCSRCLRERQADREGASLARALAASGDRAAVHLHELFAQGQAEPQATVRTSERAIELHEWAEDLADPRSVDPLTRVRNGDLRPALLAVLDGAQ